MFRGKFLRLLCVAFRRKVLRFCGVSGASSVITDFDRLIRQLKRHQWVVYPKPPLGAEHVIQYLARYTHRVAISNGRLVSISNGGVTFRWRDSAHGNQQKLMTLENGEFVRRFLLHILPSGFVKIRHFGFLSNRNRGSSLPLCRLLLEAQQTERSDNSSARTGHHHCPICRTGVMRTVALIMAAELQAPLSSTHFDSS
jgi:hypothetical protein